MDSVVEFLTGLFAIGTLVPLSAVIRPWGPFKQRWIGGAAAAPLFLIFSFFENLPPARPAIIPQGEWDRRIALCRDHADGDFKACVRDRAKLKEAEKKAAEAKKEEDEAKRAQGAADNADKPLPPDPNDKRLHDNPKIAAGVLEPYTRDSDGDLFRKWGVKGVARIEALRKTAAYAGALADIFVIGALVGILKPAPSADVVDQNGRKIRPLAFNVCDQLLQRIAAIQTKAAFAGVGVSADDLNTPATGVFANRVTLVLGRVFLVLSRHAHIFGGAHRADRRCVPCTMGFMPIRQPPTPTVVLAHLGRNGFRIPETHRMPRGL